MGFRGRALEIASHSGYRASVFGGQGSVDVPCIRLCYDPL